MWILPEMDLFFINTALKGYRGRPPGNIPELCCLDSCLNRDFNKEVYCYVSYTHSLNKFDTKKFIITTPKKRTSDYIRILIQLTASVHQANG